MSIRDGKSESVFREEGGGGQKLMYPANLQDIWQAGEKKYNNKNTSVIYD